MKPNYIYDDTQLVSFWEKILRWFDSFLSDPYWLWRIGVPPRKGKIERLLNLIGIRTPRLFLAIKATISLNCLTASASRSGSGSEAGTVAWKT